MTARRRFARTMVYVILVASVLLGACIGPTPAPTPAPTATAVPPSPTPWPPIAPIVVDYLPQPGEELSSDGVVSIFFDQPMDTATVEKAFTIEPKVTGKFEWQDNNSAVNFKPAGLERQRKYAVTVGSEAKNRANMNLTVPFKFTFTTVGFLEVSQVLPAPDTADAETSSTITVMFNRPVVPLVVSGDQSTLPNPIEIDPPVQGTGEWLNTAIYLFHPAQPLAAGRTYTVRVKAGLTDTTGGTLKEDYSWSFVTLPPSVLYYNFSDEYGSNSGTLSLSPVISVTFNQRMDHASAEAAFSLTDQAGKAVPGKFSWYYEPGVDESGAVGRAPSGHAVAAPRAGGEQPRHTETLGFRPNGRLQMDTRYTVRVTTAAQALGGTPLKDEFTADFSTVPYPSILFTSPGDGDRDVDPYSGFSIEFASAMDLTSILSHVTIEPAPTKVYTNGWSSSYFLSWDQLPSTDYTVRITPGMRDVYGNETKDDLTIRFTTRAYNPEVRLEVDGQQTGTYNGYNPTRVWVSTMNVSRLDLKLYRLSLDEFTGLTGSDSWSAWDSYQPPAADQIRAWSVPLDTPRNKYGLEQIDLWAAGNGTLDPGLYYLTLDAPELPKETGYYRQPERQLLVVSKINLTLKAALREGMVWATDLQTGAPVANVPVTLYEYDVANGRPRALAEGTTDANGVWQTGYDERGDLWTTVFAATGKTGAADFALSLSDWSSGIEAWDFNLANEYWPQDTRGYVYTDRPIYRPGQTVYFKAAVRADDDAQYSLLSAREVHAQIFDQEYREVYSDTLIVSPYGTVSGEFALSESAGLGYYELRVTLPEDVDGGTTGLASPALGGEWGGASFSVGFQVAEYRKPEYEVTVTPDKPQVVQGDTIQVQVQGTYYFGGPVADAAVEYYVFSSDFYFNWPGPGWYSFDDYDPSADNYYGGYRNDLIASGTGRTDAQGRFTISLPADLGDRVNSQTFSFDVTVTDITNQPVSGSGSVIVHKGDFYVGVAPQDYVGVVDEKQTVNLLTTGWNYAPVGQQKLQVVFMEHDWNCALKEDESGDTRWTCDVTDTPVYTTTVTTNESGKITVDYTPAKGGVYRIQAKGQDAAGHAISASGYQWIASGDYVNWRQNDNDRIDLVAGQKEYRPGDTAEVLIPSPFEGPVTALVTVERGRILQHEVITLESNSTIYRVPIKPEYTPNVYVSVVIVKGGSGDDPADFRAGLIELKVSNEQKQITLTLSPDKTQVGPRDTVTYDVRATDYAGRPVQAELSVGVIDLSVLALAGPNSAPILDSFYSERGLGVRTAVGLSVSVDRLNVKAAEAARTKGGGGGGGEAGAMTVRQEFPDTAFWKADLTTDADGRAKFSVTLPDSLTTWRLDARAISADTLVGQSTVDVIATKPLLIRPVTPRFFVVGDVATLAAVVNNNTTSPVQAEVTLAATGVDLAGAATQAVQIPASGKVRVTWQVTAGDVPAVDLTFAVSGGGMQDASKPPLGTPPEQLLPVYKYSTPDTVGTAGVLGSGETRLEVIALPSRLDVTQGELSINVAPSLAATSLDSLTYLEKYQYECIEQAISRFVPNAVTYRALKMLNMKDADLEARLPGLISDGLQRLYAEQHADGGWGWFVDYESSTYLTAYALYGMAAAEEAGFAVDANVKARAADFVKGALVAPKNVNEMYAANEQAWLLYVLARAGQGDVARTSAWYEARQKLGVYARAYLAMALHELDEKDRRPQTIMSDLVNNAILTATGAHWEESEYDWWAMNTDTRTTAIVLDALATIDPQNALAPNVVRWLMVARQGDAWSTTQETAWAVIAFTDYMAATGELEADYTWGVALNYEGLETGKADADTVRTTTRLTVDVAKLLRDASNRLYFERSDGPGKLYYTAHLRAFLPVESVQAASRGVTVQREYFRALTPGERQQCEQSEGKDAVCKPQAITAAQVGDTIQVKLTLIVPHDLYYVYVEDPLPAGTEAIDTSLLTSSRAAEGPMLEPQDWDFYWGWWYFGHTQMRDEKTVLFAQQLPAGTYVYTYQVQATLAGQFHVMPAHASEFYFPETWGRSNGSMFTITEK